MIDLNKYNSLTEKIIGAAIEVNKTLGCGFLEKVYQNAMEIELRLQQIPFNSQPSVIVYYKGKEAGFYVPDLIIFDKVIVELKAIENINYEQVQMQIINYLVATKNEVALLLNFGKTKLETKRYLIPEKHQQSK